MAKTTVGIAKGPQKPSDKQIEANVRKAIELVHGLNGIGSGDTVIIKPSICALSAPGVARCTNPMVCKAIANMVRETGARAIIAEASGVADDTESCIKSNGYDKVRAEGYEVVDLKGKDVKFTKIQIPNGKVLKDITVPRMILDAKLVISVPVMKTHLAQEVTLSLKNMKGILTDTWKKALHLKYGVAPGMADVLSTVPPGLAVVDGTLAMEGLGPMIGLPVEMGIIVAGKDAVAVDSVTSTIMGFKPEEVPLIRDAIAAGIGIADLKKIEVVGTPIKDVQRRFKRGDETIEETIPFPEGMKLLIDEKACSGCRGNLLGALRNMHLKNKLELLQGWTVIAGKMSELPDFDKGKLLLVGACTAKFKKYGTFVEGCPPWSRNVETVFTK